MHQPSLFDTQAHRRPDARTGQKVVYESPHGETQDATGDRSDSQSAAAAALEALEDEEQRETVRAQYAQLLWRAGDLGVVLTSDEGEYVAVDALTDKEAAKMLGCEKTTINARRNELMGGMPEYEACPIVVEAGSRKSYVRPTSLANTTYSINPTLLDAAQS
jgi:hypothetical protein